MQEQISGVLTKIKKGDMVRVKYHSDKRYIEIEDRLMKLKEIEKKLLLESGIEIDFGDVLAIKIITKDMIK